MNDKGAGHRLGKNCNASKKNEFLSFRVAAIVSMSENNLESREE